MASKMTVGILAFFALLWSGCKVMPVPKPATAVRGAVNEPARHEGYSLLCELLSEQAGVNKLLIVKKEPPDVQELIEEIARACGDAQDQLKIFAQEDPALNLKDKRLPWIEQKTRDSIKATRTRKLLFSSGRQFEVRLMLSQAEALDYGSHLAKALHEREKHIARKMFLEMLSRQLAGLHEKVLNLLAARMQSK